MTAAAATSTSTSTAQSTLCIICERVNYPNQVGQHAEMAFKAGLTPPQAGRRAGRGVACVAVPLPVPVAVVVVVVVFVMSKRLKSVFARSQKAEADKNDAEQKRATNANWEQR